MVHLGFRFLFEGGFGRMAGSIRHYPASDQGATQASQNAAAMLFDLGTVDVR
jgi:hypothetical protein